MQPRRAFLAVPRPAVRLTAALAAVAGWVSTGIAEARERPRERAGAVSAALAGPLEAPVQLFVSLPRQRLSIYSKGRLVETVTVSTGTGSHPTPAGVFAILDKEEEHYSNIYGGASMPFMQRLTMSGVALHSGQVTGRPASHGCIRLPHAFAKQLFGVTKLGVRVFVTSDDAGQTAISHPRLPVPVPPAPIEVATAGSGDAPTMAAGPAGAPDRIPTPEEFAAAQPETPGARKRRGWPRGYATMLRERALASIPVSVLVSRAAGKVFVRHGFKQVMEADLTFREPDRPLGTHVFTALEVDLEARSAHWGVVTLKPGEPPRKVRVASRRAKAAAAEAPPAPAWAGTPSTAAEALERFELPPEIALRVSRMLSPGASIIVSDLGPSREMRATLTDFIILTP